MKKYILLLMFLSCSNLVFADDWHGKDKNLHFFGGTLISSSVAIATKNELYGFYAGAFAGFAKEVYDAERKNGDVSEKDFIVTLIGAAVGAKIPGLILNKDKVEYIKKWSW